MPSSDLQKRLKALGTKWAKQVTREANKAFGKPKHIKVKSHSEVTNGGVDVISEATSPKGDANAYEYGSGIRSRRSRKSKFQQGAKGYIRIAPKGKKVLAFMWDKVDKSTPAGKKFRGISKKTGKALFNYVEHPGVQAAGGGKGYLAPAINNARKQMRKDIPKEVREEVSVIFRRAFSKK